MLDQNRVLITWGASSRHSRYGIPRNPPLIASSQSQKRSTQSQPYSTFSSATETQRHKRLKQERNGRPIACAPTSLLSVNEALAFPSELKYEDDDIFSSQSAVTPALPGPSATALKTFGSQLPSTSLSKRSGSQPVSNAFTPILLQGIEDAVRDVISKGKRFTSDDVYTATDGLLRKMNVSLAQEAILENIELKLAEYVNQGHLEIVMSKSGRRYQIAEDWKYHSIIYQPVSFYYVQITFKRTDQVAFEKPVVSVWNM